MNSSGPRVWQTWNWKSALLSAAFRAPIFLVTGYRFGWRSVTGAVVAESAFRVLTSGFYGAIAQRLTLVRPFWKAAVVLVAFLPLCEQLLDYAIHRLRGTPNLKWAMLTSCVVMALSAMFNWFAMRRGVLLTDRRGGSLFADLKQLPRVLWDFLWAAPHALRRGLTRRGLQ